MSSFERERFVKNIQTQGYEIVEGVLDKAFTERCKRELDAAIVSDAEKYGEAGRRDYGMVLLCSLHGGTFLEALANPRLMEPFNAVLGEGCIIYAYTSSSMPPSSGNYSVRIHVDCPRIIPNYVTNMGATILLDDFTEENGATWFLPGSQTRADAPSEDEFYRNSKRLIAKAGSVLYFNARLWHAGGQNKTNVWRHALTINMGRSYMKQRIDIPRAMSSMDCSKLPQSVLQKLGFLSQPPTSLEEYYLPLERRSYKQPVE